MVLKSELFERQPFNHVSTVYIYIYIIYLVIEVFYLFQSLDNIAPVHVYAMRGHFTCCRNTCISKKNVYM